MVTSTPVVPYRYISIGVTEPSELQEHLVPIDRARMCLTGSIYSDSRDTKLARVLFGIAGSQCRTQIGPRNDRLTSRSIFLLDFVGSRESDILLQNTVPTRKC